MVTISATPLARWRNLARALVVCALALLSAQCARFGTAPEPAPEPIARAAVVSGTPDLLKDVKPILDHRCVGCHACNDVPCQLNFSAFEGLERGANKTEVYDSTRLRAAEPSASLGAEVFTITRDNFMTNVASLFGEDKRRRPDKDALTVARGIIGTYPNAYFRVTVADPPAYAALESAEAGILDFGRLENR